MTSIGNNAFYGCRGLTSITIPNSVTSIGDNAFYGCSNLTSVYSLIEVPFEISSSTFSTYYNATLYVPKGSKPAYLSNRFWFRFSKIDDGTEYNCEKVREVFVSEAGTLSNFISKSEMYFIEELTLKGELNGADFRLLRDMAGNNDLGKETGGQLSFLDMSDVRIVHGGGNYLNSRGVHCNTGGIIDIGILKTSIENDDELSDFVFAGCVSLKKVKLPNSITLIGDESFFGCANLDSIEIPQDVKTLKGAFTYCSKLSYVKIPNSVTSIGGSAFKGCSGLTSVTIPNSVTSIGYDAFYGCRRLTSISIPNSITSIGNSAFGECSGLTSITIPNSVTSISNYVFFECSGLTSITIPNGVTSIGNYAFYGCSGLTSITIPNGVTSIGNYAFSCCSGLTSITIPNDVTSIGNYAFSWCSGLTSITIPNSVTSIGSSAFAYCSGLTSIISEIQNPFEIDEMAFSSSYTKATLTVPSGTKSKYQQTIFWNKFTNIVEASSSNDESSKIQTIHVATAGALPNLIPEYEKYIVEKLTLTGELNGTDFRLLRDMAGNNYLGQNTSGKLAVLDLSNAKVVEGGEKYLDTNLIDGSGIRIDGSFHYDVSQDDEMPMYVFCGCNLKTVIIPNSVTSIGSSAFYGCSALTSVTIGNSVTNIEGSVFSSCSSLESVTIGAGVQSIESNIFNNHRPAKVIWLANTPPSGYNYASGIMNYVANDQYTSLNNKTIYRFLSSTFEVDGVKYVPVSPSERICDAIDCTYEPTAESLKIGEMVEYKGVQMKVNQVHPYTCYNNQHIKDVKITCPGDVGQYAFYNCKTLATVEANIGGAIGNNAFQSCTTLQMATLGEQVSGIGQYAFSNCSNLQGIVIPDAVMTMGRNAFEICTNMESVKMGTGVETIETYTFTGCSALKDMQIGSNVKNINTYAFNACSSLPLIEITQSVTTINNNVFDGCTALKDVYIADRTSVLTLGYHYYSNNSNNNKPLFADCPLDSVYIGGNISYGRDKYSGYSPFYRNTSLRSVHITDLETEISDNEFYGCTGLKNVRIGDGVTAIGNWAFSGCSSLDYFRFGGSVETIGKEAFSDCVAVTRVISRAATPPVCGSQALDDLNKWECRLEVPKGMAAAYQEADQWKEFFFVLEGDPSIFKYDIDGSDTVDNNDVNILVKAIIGRGNTSTMLKGDLNNDGFVNMADVTKLIDYILGRTQ